MSRERNFNTLEHLTKGTLLARNTIYNIGGQISPLIVALVAIPLLIKGLGTERFGVLTLAWILVGYFSLFDLGLGRVLTKFLGEKLVSADKDDIPSMVWTGIFMMAILGAIATLLVFILSPWLVYHLLKVPKALQNEAYHAFIVLGICIPLVTCTSAFRGILEAQQYFGIINIVRIINGLLSYLGPLLASFITPNLVVLVSVLAIGRLIFFVVYLLLCFHTMPSLRHIVAIDKQTIVPMFRLGGWMTVSNVVGPFLVYFDRFLIGAYISVVALTYYVTPYEIVTKLWLITSSLTAVLFPAFSSSYAINRNRSAIIYSRGIRTIFLALFPLTLFIISFAHPGLKLWLGIEFAVKSSFVLQILAIGVFVNSIGQVPFTLLQASGRPDLTAKLHITELPFYLFGLWWLINRFGIKGAAMAWSLRILIDTAALSYMSYHLLREFRLNTKRLWLGLALAGFLIMFSILPMGIILRFATTLFAALIFLSFGWFYIIDSNEQEMIKRFFKKKSIQNIVPIEPT